ncbi:MAG TPA: Ig-like domain-containing protein, partial [Thermoanaerobaculia bacterium]
MFRLLALLAVVVTCTSLFAQSTTTFTETFEQYDAQSEPAGWLDTSGQKFRTYADPLLASNVIYGAKHGVPKQRSVHRRGPAATPEGGAYSTLSGRTFELGDGFEYRGRFYRGSSDALLGFTFFSAQPEGSVYRMVALWRRGGETAPTMRLYRNDVQNADSAFTPAPAQWYRFAIRADVSNAGTRIRVRFWPDGTVEPQSWAIDTIDSNTSRSAGRIGLWSLSGTTYFDDLTIIARSEEEVDTMPPAILFSESGEGIAHGATEGFKRNARIDVRALDASGIRSLDLTLDGAAYTSGALIETEQPHVLRARAVDNKGNASEAAITVVIDKTPPAISVTNVPELTKQSVAPQISANEGTIAATLNGAPFVSGTVVDAPGTYILAVTVTDAVGWTSTSAKTFVIDRAPPEVLFTANGARVIGSLARNSDVAIALAATDANGIASLTATFNNAPFTSGALVTSSGTLVAHAVDRAGNEATAQLAITIDKSKPAVTIANVPPLTNRPVTPEITSSAGIPVATLNGAPFILGTTITAEGEYTLSATATDLLGNTGSATTTFEIDLTVPAIAFTESGVAVATSITRNRDVTVAIAATDANDLETLTATFNGAPYTIGSAISTSGTLVARAIDKAGNETTAQLAIVVDKVEPVVTIEDVLPLTNQPVTPRIVATEGTLTVTLNGIPFAGGVIEAEGTYTLVATANDAAGNEGTATVTFIIDRTPPSIALSENGESVSVALARNRDVAVQIAASDANGIASLESKLDGATYTSGALITASGTLAVRAVDKAGNEATAQLAITVDKLGPVVTIEDVPALTNKSVTPKITATKGTLTVTLNGNPFTSGTVDEEREHTLVATAIDSAGNRGSASVTFIIDRTPPSIALTENGQSVCVALARNRDVAVQIAANDANGLASLEAKLDGASYTSGALITASGTLAVRAVDKAGNEATAQLAITVDKISPVVTIENVPAITNQSVTPKITATEGTLTVTLNGNGFTPGVIEEEREHTLVATAVDAAGNSGSASVTFIIDRTPPLLTFTSPAAESKLGSRQVVVAGTFVDAVRIVINGVEAVLEGNTFTATVELLEGANTLVATAFDRAGNESAGSLRVHLDTRAPELSILAPVANACLAGTEVTVRGTTRAGSQVAVRVNGGAPVAATVTGGEWTATVPVPEGKVTLTVIATDDANRTVSSALPLVIDRTKPLITVTERGAPFTATLLNREIAPFVRVQDADSNAKLTLTLDGAAYVSGTAIAAEGTHVVKAGAVDCAGNVADAFERTFRIDRTPPAIVTTNPANGGAIGTKPVLTGTLSEPATVSVEATGLAADVNGTNFTLAVPFDEGLNELGLIATDPAGNSARVAYSLRVRTTAPFVEIVENGLPIPAAALFNRPLAPLVRVSDSSATLSATLNGQPFTSGSRIAADGAYTLVAKATDAFGHVSDEATATFTIDRTPPRVTITAPADDTLTGEATIEVRGTVDADAQSVSINGRTAPVTNGTFVLRVNLEHGPNVLAATAVDRAGNSARSHVGVIRASTRLAIFLTSPPDELLTNRPTTVVAGQVLNAPAGGRVRINNVEVPLDAAGAFRKVDFALAEGENEITATVAGATGELNEVSVDVTADFTPPALLVAANGLALAEGARFAVAPRIELEAADNVPAGLVTRLTVDGAAVTGQLPLLGEGGHALTAIARDAAGNETRVDRTFFVGT